MFEYRPTQTSEFDKTRYQTHHEQEILLDMFNDYQLMPEPFWGSHAYAAFLSRSTVPPFRGHVQGLESLKIGNAKIANATIDIAGYCI